MGMLKEFRDFAMRGSVIDLAVGVVIGAAFSGIVQSFVQNMVMPPLNLITYKMGVNFSNLALKIQGEGPKLDATGKIMKDDAGNMIKEVGDIVILKYGPFLESIVNFILIAAAVFIAIKMFNKAKARFEEPKVDAPAEVPADIALLTEIRDALKRDQPRRTS
jgi:large conductance mechanosensitive channel